MGMVEAGKRAVDTLTPKLNETYQAFGKRLYIAQQEAYDYYSGYSLAPYSIFDLLPEETKNSWFEIAKKRISNLIQ